MHIVIIIVIFNGPFFVLYEFMIKFFITFIILKVIAISIHVVDMIDIVIMVIVIMVIKIRVDRVVIL